MFRTSHDAGGRLRSRRRRLRLSGFAAVAAALLVTAFAPFARAGGFGIQVSLPLPEATGPEKDAALILTAIGCHGPGATISATAEGLVGNERRSVPLTLVALPLPTGGDRTSPAFPRYALTRQWPTRQQGTWVLVLNATAPPHTFQGKTYRARSTALLPLGPGGSTENLPTYGNTPDVAQTPPNVAQILRRTLRVQYLHGSPAENAKAVGALLTKLARGSSSMAAGPSTTVRSAVP